MSNFNLEERWNIALKELQAKIDAIRLTEAEREGMRSDIFELEDIAKYLFDNLKDNENRCEK